MVSHRNILHNQALIQSAFEQFAGSTIVSWLPLHHDMGLIGTVLHSVYIGARAVLMSPGWFFQKPALWLQAISRYRARCSSAPNFAYELCTRKVSAAQKSGLDLTHWQIAVSGAEPVRYETMQRFVAAFGECGFCMEAFRPSYGLAEATLLVAGARSIDMPIARRLSSIAMESNLAQEASDSESARLLVGCGSTLPGHELRVVDSDAQRLCPENRIGELWVRGASVAHGYWGRPEETAHTFQAYLATGEGPFLRTGDLGFVAEGQVFLTGRAKDLIIIRGRNLYPHDIELAVQNSHPSLVPNAGAAFAIEVDGEDVLVVANEVERHPDDPLETILSIVRETLLLEFGVDAYTVVLVKIGAIPKTTSGKIRRVECRRAFLARDLDLLASNNLPLYRPINGALPESPRAYSVPITPTEELTARIWSEILGVSQVSRSDDFFALGGHSLLATQMLLRVQNTLNLEISFRELFESSTLAGFAARIEQVAGAKTAHYKKAGFSIKRVPRETISLPVEPGTGEWGQEIKK